MRKALLAVSVLILASPAARALDFPRAAPPTQPAGTRTTFNALLSGTITPYAAGGGLNYLTVSVNGKLRGGIYIAPTDLASQLRGYMNPNRNYTVNLVYVMDRVNINGFTPAYAVVARVDFLDANGQPYASFAAGR